MNTTKTTRSRTEAFKWDSLVGLQEDSLGKPKPAVSGRHGPAANRKAATALGLIVLMWTSAASGAVLSSEISQQVATAPQEARATLASYGIEWCGTDLQYLLKNQARVEAAYSCPIQGPPDVPGIRDGYIPVCGTPAKVVRLRFHLLRTDSGSFPAASESDVMAQVAQLNTDFAQAYIQFVYSWRYVDSTKYRYLDDTEMSAMKLALAEGPSVQHNIYVTDVNGGWIGMSTFPWDSDALLDTGGTVLDGDFCGLGQKTLTHEVGHALGLWHTHHGVSEVSECSACYERADGLNADTTGDFCSDTAPTPMNFACSPVGEVDPCSGQFWGSTDPQNYMSYAPDYCYSEFTAQQMGRMHGWIEERLTGWLDTPSVALGEAVDVAELVWNTGGDSTWAGQTAINHDGSDAAISGLITHGDQSWMETTVEGPGLVSFWWGVSSEASYDFVRFLDNGVQLASISGTLDWSEKQFELSEGQHTLRWNYTKDGSVSLGSDRGWVDQVQYVWLPKPIELLPPVVVANGVRLFVRNTDGTTVDPSRNIGVYYTADLALPVANWSQLTGGLVATNGMLQIDDLGSSQDTQRFYIATENP